jgi:sulfur-carrier protein
MPVQQTFLLKPMKLRFYAFFKDVVGSGEMNYERPAANLGVLLADLTCRYGRPFSKWVYAEDGRLSHMVIILVNGKDVRDALGLATPLTPEDTVVLFPPLAGGS